jgi:hypothetical protein
MRPPTRRLSQVADRAGLNRPSVSLQCNGLQVILGFAGRQDGVRTVMTALTIQPAMAGRKPIQGTGIFAVLAAMTIAAARLIMPGSTVSGAIACIPCR